ncbi:MAG: hypothetical protein NMNS02_22030 [Nitrosomonas sp.]|nr:MAG: hypothetical protein NMNS02_22030 [Nitrosomonas sp.]
MAVFVDEANGRAFDPIGCFQHNRKTDCHNRYAEWSRHREKNDTDDKNDHSDHRQEGAYDHSQTVVFIK